jgi:hypothetical protein
LAILLSKVKKKQKEAVMKKISKKVCALVLMLGLLFAPVRYASADFDPSEVDYTYVGQHVNNLSVFFVDVFNVFGYAGAASFVSDWASKAVSFLKNLNLFFNVYKDVSAQYPYGIDK